ncbi:hypothetical protein ACTUSZ_03775 [Pantoea eucalypti]|jgi:hypothetical protein|uniref:Uncharacterized protein n=1 Tax=Pantoea eucalypti TaxID=470933 RepID=A0ABY2ZMP4_9GAMM|nr:MULTISPECIES: hypothetical protein [Pantoea]PQL27755.1 hypothetical protein C5L22_15140 [Pantoea ananatis]QXG56903.1 hypothetical protein KTJ90_19940 [Pantoea jilinensis]TPD93549.1 hypothetical protein FJP68_14255 [Pantoea vagans]EFM21679.1 conserved hypothetical protein [Pantoea sp. aB]ELP23042.1 hypothetical protein F385_3890 [Pantoea agglomerans 299R]
MSIVYIPALIPLLMKKENEKGSPLTEDEVRHVRDNATFIEVPRDVAFTMAECRGYFDINPEHCWSQWCSYRRENLLPAAGNV